MFGALSSLFLEHCMVLFVLHICVSPHPTQKFENVITKHLVFSFNILLPPKFETITQRNHWLFTPIPYFPIVIIGVFSILFHLFLFRTWVKACIKSGKCHIVTHLAHQTEPMIRAGTFCVFHHKGLIVAHILIHVWVWF